jgi:hypothetical protein
MSTVTGKQWLQISGGIVSGLITGAALLQTLFGQDLALKLTAALGIAGIVINSVGTAISGQSSLVKDVAAMPGVEKITVNAQANTALAQVAVSDEAAAAKVVALPQAVAAVEATAGKAA